jgi:hypothetical protein
MLVATLGTAHYQHQQQTMPRPAIDVLRDWARPRITPEALSWIESAASHASEGGVSRAFFVDFGLVSRKVGRTPLSLSDAELEAAAAIHPGWDPRGWSLDTLGRAWLVLALPADDPAALVGALDRLFADADLGEQIALYRSLPLLPHPEAHRARCAEGIRSNMTDVFEAVALDNPYPAEQLAEAAWNQLVLKAIFVGCPLHRVVGLDRRANPTLARMLVDFARERRSAGRAIPPQLWRCAGPQATGKLLDAVEAALASGDDAEARGAALSVQASAEAAGLRDRHPAVFAELAATPWTWESLWKGNA